MQLQLLDEMGAVQVLASGRLGRQVATNEARDPVYVGEIDASGERAPALCKHGERHPTISGWLHMEKRPDFKGRTDSVCDCDGTLGLHFDLVAMWAKRMSNVTGCSLADARESTLSLLPTYTAPSDVYDAAIAMGNKTRMNNKRPQVFLCVSPETKTDIYMQPIGRLVCEHGNCAKYLRKMNPPDEAVSDRCRSASKQKLERVDFDAKRRTSCSCKFVVPRRWGSRLLPPYRKPAKKRVRDADDAAADADGVAA